MKFTIKYHQGIIKVKATGDAELKVFGDLIKALVSLKNWKPGGRFLLDCTELNTGPLTTKEVKSIAIMSQHNRKEFGMGRMWQVFVDNNWDVKEKIFKSKDEATSWLLV